MAEIAHLSVVLRSFCQDEAPSREVEDFTTPECCRVFFTILYPAAVVTMLTILPFRVAMRETLMIAAKHAMQNEELQIEYTNSHSLLVQPRSGYP